MQSKTIINEQEVKSEMKNIH